MDRQTMNTLKQGQPVRLIVGKHDLGIRYFKAVYGDDLVLWTGPEKVYHIKAHHTLVHLS